MDINLYQPSTYVHDSHTIDNTTTLVKSENIYRKSLLLVNTSDENIYVTFGVDATTDGIPIYPGGSYNMSIAEYNNYTGVINAICASGSKSLISMEGV